MALKGPKSVNLDLKSTRIKKVANCNLNVATPCELLQLNSSLGGIPDEIKVGKITFRIDKDACIGLANSRVKEKRPAMVSVPMGNKKYSYLAFLQVLAYAPAEKGADLFEYRLNYGDNFTSSVSMKNKVNLFDWWYQPDERQKNLMERSDSYCAWSGDNGSGHTVYVYAYIWKNPDPHKEIMSLDIGGGDPGKKNTLGIF